ncbi:DMT family transporter [Rubellimicrobium aerolatum]|uniref:DMT family transporter n=1 Tax=Rubellimicrobium aerolatum TaxID=490979 RepID=A0ABW0SCG2_9RHOB|nr:drug/metabolite transporter (DMT)-like permease [Rubellimicrobium aerolatum]
MTRPLAGIVWMVLSGLFFVGMTAIVKHVGSDVPAAQSAFLRFALGLPFAVPMLWPLWRTGVTAGQARLCALRGAVHTLGVLLWFFAMTRIPLAEVTAMNYLNPIYVTLGAALFLGERWEARRLLAVGAALVGALVILRPGLRAVEPGHVAMLGASLLLASGYLVAKRLSGQVPATVVVGMLSATVTLGLLPFAVAVWVPVGWAEIGWFFGTACFATLAHYCMTRAFAAAPAGATQPATFLQLVWSVLLGAVAFGEPVDGWVILGGGIIMAAVSAVAWREAVARRVAAEG